MGVALRSQPPQPYVPAKALTLSEIPSLRAGSPRKVNPVRTEARKAEREVLAELLESCGVSDTALASDCGNDKAERFGAQLRTGSLSLTLGEAVMLPRSLRFAISVATSMARRRLKLALEQSERADQGSESKLSSAEETQVRLVLAYLDSIESLISKL